jgi:hypothetical protein
MTLPEQISARAREIRTDGYGMSIGEVLSLYRDGDIDIHPEFQRIYRWEDGQKSKLIESILLGIPIPPIFVSQRSDGIWDVIDGVQRLSTILEFVGEYKDEDDELKPELVLEAGEYLTELANYVYSDTTLSGGRVFDEALRRDFKRAKLDFRIITKESDPNAKYDLFQRLNSGSVLSPQEARNCLMVMINRDLYGQVVGLSDHPSFKSCVLLSERQEEQAYREELILRFFCQADYTGGPTELPKEYGEYVTDWMKRVAESSQGPVLDGGIFDRTFGLLADALGEDTFRRFEGGRHLGPFSISSYEFTTTGLAENIDVWEQQTDAALKERIESIWSAPEFRNNSGTGVSPRRRVPRLIVASREYFKV